MYDILDLRDCGITPLKSRTRAPICLVGKLCAAKSHNIFALIDVMIKAFRPKGKLTGHDWGNGMVIFSFEKENDRQWVLWNQPWHFDGHLFTVYSLTGMEQSSPVSISTTYI